LVRVIATGSGLLRATVGKGRPVPKHAKFPSQATRLTHTGKAAEAYKRQIQWCRETNADLRLVTGISTVAGFLKQDPKTEFVIELL
jgi:hypothetical protein